MPRHAALGLLVLAAVAAAAPARASDTGPVFVVPSRPGIPVIINGVDASYAVVEGDWGLARPGAVPVIVFGGRPVLPNPVYTQRNPYLPRHGRMPERGRYEVEPAGDRPLPEPAETFSRSWSTSSDLPPPPPGYGPYPQPHSYNSNGADAVPATITDPQTFPPDLNVPVIVDPRRRR